MAKAPGDLAIDTAGGPALRLRVLPALALTIGLLLATFVYAFAGATNRRIEAERALTVERATLLFDVELRNYTALMSSTLEGVTRDEALQSEMVAGNRDALLARLAPMFETLRSQFGIEHFYVHRPDRVNVLRVHEPSHSGDTINRLTLLTAQRTGVPASGIEQGPTGQSALRVVYPWKHKDQLIGYLELGTEFDTLAHRVHEVMGVEVMVFVYKKLLKRDLWDRRNVKAHQTTWDHFPTVVLVDSTAPEILPAVEAEVSSDRILDQSMVSKNADRHTQIVSLPLKDVDGRTLGGIFVLRDVTEIFSQARRSIILVSAACLFVAALVLACFYVFLGRIQRTLEEKNAKLAEANATLEQRVETRTEELKAAQHQLVEAARHVGQAEVAANVLHNVGNVLNSTNVSVQQLERLLESSGLATLTDVAELLEHRKDDLGKFVTADPKGMQIPGYIRMLADDLTEERSELVAEVRSLAKNVSHLKSVIQAQQSYARPSARIEGPVDPKELIDDALHMAGQDLQQSSVRIVREYDGVRGLIVDKQKLLQILVNIVTNAKQAVMAAQSANKSITFRLAFKPDDPQRVLLEVSDTGVGIPPENLSRIFQHGFTTKPGGHGFGLHSAALTARELGGMLTAESEGLERGARFTLELPLNGAGAGPRE
jgi:signal transduction histidine kinase